MSNEPIVLPFHWSPNTIKIDQRCPQELLWSKFFEGTGIRATGESFDMDLGTILHAVLLDTPSEMPAKDVGELAEKAVEELCKKALIQEPLRTEWPIFYRALAYAFRSRVWPGLLREYEVVRAEGTLKPVQVLHWDGREFQLPWNTRPDLILRHRALGHKVYWDLKNTSLDQSAFCKSWIRSPQMHIGCWAFGEVHGADEMPEGFIVQGAHKGSKYKGSLRGSFITLYRKDNVLGHASYGFEYKKGWERGLISEYPGGVEAWIDQLPDAEVAEYFPATPLTAKDDDLISRSLERAGKRAREIYEFQNLCDNVIQTAPEEKIIGEIDALIRHYFPRNFPDACENLLTHRRCAYYECCWNPTVGRDPVGSGLYITREDELHGNDQE